jgi:hypothetical protein
MQQAEPAPAAPALSDYDYDEGKYAMAMADHNQKIIDLRVTNAVDNALNKKAQQEMAQEQHLNAMDNAMRFNEREAVIRQSEGFEDYDFIARNPNLISVYPQEMISQINASEWGPQLAYELGKNEAEALRIARLSPADIGFSLGQIQGRIARNSKQSPPTVKTTKAPQPITPVGGLDTASVSDKEIGTLSQTELRAKLGMSHLGSGN